MILAGLTALGTCCVLQRAFVENLDHGQFFDLLYEGEDDILKLDALEMVANVRQTYPFVCQ